MKAFLIIGNLNAVTYKEVFPLIKDGKVGLGVNGVKTFIMPSGDARKFGNIVWFTTLSHDHINPPLTLTATYTPEAYPRYDNYDAIEAGRTKDIPCDYDGVMGVPISFLDKWCPEQFEVVGVTHTWFGAASKTYGKQVQVNKDGSTQIVTKLNDGPSILLPTVPPDKVYYAVDGNAYKELYNRILIRRRKSFA